VDGNEYKASLLDGRRVYVRGERVEDVANHPDFKASVEKAAATYDYFHADPEAKSAYLSPPSDIESMRAHASMKADGLAHFTYSSIMTLLTAAERVAETRPETREAVRHYIDEVRCNDWRITECITDAKGDRSKSPSQQGDPDAYLRVVERRRDGVLIRGAKLHISLSPICHELMVIPTKAMKANEEDYAVACAVPVNSPGVSIVSVTNGQTPEGADPRDFPFGADGAIPQGFVIFDDVFVPRERLFLDGETALASVFAHSLGLWVRASSMIGLCDSMDRLVGLAQLAAEANGLQRTDHIKLKISEMAITATLVRGTLEAAILHAKRLPEGMLAPDETYINAGKYHAAANYSLMVRHLLDIAGGSAITAPSMSDIDNVEIGPLVRKYMSTTDEVDGAWRTQLFHAIHDATSSAYGGANYVGLLLAGGGLYAQNVVTRVRYDMARAKALALESMGVHSPSTG
jgi:4-hydroxybutyryl-CoA dehydratase/vinylacetyl-CoA-Delta-isomerase